MAFDAREHVTASPTVDYPPFEFTGLDGKPYELPHPLTLTERQVDKINSGDPKGVIEDVAPEAFNAIQDMPSYVSKQLGQQWLSEAQESGKSPSASRRTRRAVKPSKRTSQSAA
jgi:hypothetical protein